MLLSLVFKPDYDNVFLSAICRLLCFLVGVTMCYALSSGVFAKRCPDSRELLSSDFLRNIRERDVARW